MKSFKIVKFTGIHFLFNKKKSQRNIRDVSKITKDDLDNLRELFEANSPIEGEPSIVKVNPKSSIIRRLRIRGLIDVGQYGEGYWTNFGDGKKVIEDGEVSIVARLTGLGQVAIWHPSAEDLIRYKDEYPDEYKYK